MQHVKDIEALLEKYWAGETSLEEERQIKRYFAQGEVDSRLQGFAPLFRAIREEQTVQLEKTKTAVIKPMMYGTKLWMTAASVALLLVAGWWLLRQPEPAAMANQTKETIVPIDTPQAVKAIPAPEAQYLAEAQPEAPPRPKVKKRRPVVESAVAEVDPEAELAMEEIKAALALLSSKLGKGRREAAKGAEHLEAVDKIFKKQAG